MANKIHKAFENIKADEQLKESTKQFLESKRRKRITPVKYLIFQNKFVIACLTLILIMGIGGYSWIQSPVSYISIDINPSIELALNHFDRVVSVTAYNPEGEEIIKNLSLKGKIYTSAIDEIVENNIMDTYITKESEIIFTIATNNGHENIISTEVQRCCDHSGHNSHNISADSSLISQAHDNELSLGKYYAILQLMQYDDTITIDNCRDMNISEIYDLITMYEQNTEYKNSDTNNGCCSQEHGRHHHMHAP